MMRKFTILCAAIAVLASSVSLVNAQDPSKKGLASNWDLHVEIKTSKTTYLPDESIHYRVILRNDGHAAVYIARSFYSAGGGIAGFYVSVKQLTGKANGIGCVAAGDRFFENDPRTPEQILREDYLLLGPGGIVGFESEYDSCVVKHPGNYQITATYSAQDLNLGKVRLLADKADEIVTGQFHSAASAFRVRGR